MTDGRPNLAIVNPKIFDKLVAEQKRSQADDDEATMHWTFFLARHPRVGIYELIANCRAQSRILAALGHG